MINTFKKLLHTQIYATNLQHLFIYTCLSYNIKTSVIHVYLTKTLVTITLLGSPFYLMFVILHNTFSNNLQSKLLFEYLIK